MGEGINKTPTVSETQCPVSEKIKDIIESHKADPILELPQPVLFSDDNCGINYIGSR